MQTESSLNKIIAAVLVVTLAATYFLLTFNRTLNPADEGYLLYNFQKAANGQIAHRDFYDAYGPGIYWVGSALFNLFGPQIIVIKLFVVALKTLMVLLLFLIARRIVPLAFAFLGAFLFILNWGDPLIGPVNVLYAGHVNQLLAMLGVFFMLVYIDSERSRWLLATSGCVGLSMLFKLHVPIVDLVGFSLALCLREQSFPDLGARSDSDSAHPRLPALRLLRTLKLFGIFGAAGFFLFYLAGRGMSVERFILFLLPISLILAYVIYSEISVLRDMRENTASVHWEGMKRLYGEIAILVVGPIISVILLAGYYSVAGGLSDYVHDVFVLPTYIKYHHSMPDGRLIAGIAAGIVAAVLLAVHVGKRLERKGALPRRLFVGIILLLLVAPLVAAFWVGLSYRYWHKLATHVLLPAALTAGVCLFVSKRSQHRRSMDDIKERWLLALVLIFASQSLLLMSLRSDETHIVVYSTVIFAAIAYVLYRLFQAVRRVQPGAGTIVATVAVVACVAAVSIPYVWSTKILFIPTYPRSAEPPRNEDKATAYYMLVPESPRARGLKLPVWPFFTPPLHHPMFVDMNQTIDYVREHTSPEERIFITCGDQIIYFLAERESALQKENYFAYLANTELIDQANTGTVSDDKMLERLASANPRLIIGTPRFADTVYFGLTWPKTQMFIDSGYEVEAVIGEYQILRRRGSSSHRQEP